MLCIAQVGVMDAPILQDRQVIGQQEGRVDWSWPQQVWFWGRVLISQQPEGVAFPWWGNLDVLQIDLQLIGDALRSVC